MLLLYYDHFSRIFIKSIHIHTYLVSLLQFFYLQMGDQSQVCGWVGLDLQGSFSYASTTVCLLATALNAIGKACNNPLIFSGCTATNTFVIIVVQLQSIVRCQRLVHAPISD